MGPSGNSGGGGRIEPTEDMKAAQEVNAKMHNFYTTYYKPVLEKWTARTTNPEANRQVAAKVAGQVNAEIMKNMTPKNASSSPVSGAKHLSDMATLETVAQQKAAGKVQSKQLKDVQNVIDVGRGQATTASTGLNILADQSVTEAIQDKEIELQKEASNRNKWGSIAGSALGAALSLGSNYLGAGKALDESAMKKAANSLVDDEFGIPVMNL